MRVVGLSPSVAQSALASLSIVPLSRCLRSWQCVRSVSTRGTTASISKSTNIAACPDVAVVSIKRRPSAAGPPLTGRLHSRSVTQGGSARYQENTDNQCARHDLRCRAGAVRGFAQASESRSGGNFNDSGVKSFEQDCKIVEECSDLINARLDIPALKSKLAELNDIVADPTLYDDTSKANRIVTERSKVEAKLLTVERLTSELEQWREMHEMAISEGEANLVRECVDKVGLLRREAEKARAETLLALAGEFSSSNCFLELQAGAGGTESHDWTQMLLRMYTLWAERRGFTVKTLNSSSGDEAGLRAATVLLEGDSAYGWLRTEAGVHRLVRNSPFDAGQRRHTSFAQVRIFPETESLGGRGASAIDIPTKDLRIDTMRSQGAGGQHVNTTDSAVRITHLPSGLVAVSQSDRSQHRNKDTAMRVLRAKLFQRAEEERRTTRNAYAQGLGDNAFGNQIRSYVMSPYQLVKDHRTGHQDGDVTAVLDGDVDAFIEAALMAELREGSDEEQDDGKTH